MMRRLDNDADASGLKDLADRIGDLHRHSFLNLQTPRVGVYDSRELADANDAAFGHIGYPSFADDRSQMVFAVALKPYATQHNHFIVSIYFFERFLQDLSRILRVACKVLLERTRQTCRGFDQAGPIRIITSPANNGSKRRFGRSSLGFA